MPGFRNILPKKPVSNYLTSIDNAVSALNNGGVVIMPTDTVYGLAILPDFPDAAERIYQIKGRERGKPLPLLVADMKSVLDSGARMGEIELKLARRFWPGPLTLVLGVDGKDEKDGYRVPAHDVAVHLIRAAGGMLRVTSANLSGKPPALTAEEAVKSLGGRFDAVVDAGRTPGGTASTVVEILTDGEKVSLNVIREGAISRIELERVMNE